MATFSQVVSATGAGVVQEYQVNPFYMLTSGTAPSQRHNNGSSSIPAGKHRVAWADVMQLRRPQLHC
jgi:hypothetical protein